MRVFCIVEFRDHETKMQENENNDENKNENNNNETKNENETIKSGFETTLFLRT